MRILIVTDRPTDWPLDLPGVELVAARACGMEPERITRQARGEGIVVIDDPASILRCTSKVFLAEPRQMPLWPDRLRRP